MLAPLFLRRLVKEKDCPGKRDRDAPILSSNPKTGLSLNLPVLNCQPTRACAANCYACQGPIAFRDAIEKAIAIDRWIRTEPEWAAEKVASETRGSLLRLNGSGDMTLAHIAFVSALLEHGVEVFGFTKRPATWLAIRELGVELMFSLDVTTGARRLTWALSAVPRRRRAYCRRPGDPDWSRRVAVTFPEHGSVTSNSAKVPRSRTDCPAVRVHVRCSDCGRCY